MVQRFPRLPYQVNVRPVCPAIRMLFHPLRQHGGSQRDHNLDLPLPAQSVCRLQHLRQVGVDLFLPAARQQRNPLLFRVQPVANRILLASDRRQRQRSQRMPHKLRVHPARPVKRLLEREDHQHPVHSPLHPAQPPPLPRPQLRAHKVEHRDPTPAQVPGQPQVHVRKVDQDRHIRPVPPDRAHQLPVLAPNVRRVTDHLRQSHVGYVLGPHHPRLPRRFHRASAQADKRRLRKTAPQPGDNLRSVVVA